MGSEIFEEVISELKEIKDKIFKEMEEEEERRNKFLFPEKSDKSRIDQFSVLRRWNSFTPVVPRENEERSREIRGGGYFLTWKGKGIVIDPGFNFIENFYRAGFRFADIDAIMITHAHIDHCIEFEPLLTLLFEYNEKNDKKIDLFLNLGATAKFSEWVTLKDKNIRSIYVLNQSTSKKFKCYSMKIHAVYAKHDEVISDKYCIGVIFELIDETGEVITLGITSDTGWECGIAKPYYGCDILVVHFGGIGRDEFDATLSFCERLYDKHLGVIGATKMIEEANPKLAIVSEFGEELGGDRVDIVHKIGEVLSKSGCSSHCLTGDLGLDAYPFHIKLSRNLKIYCSVCNCDVSALDIKDFYYRPGRCVGYVCKRHTTEEILASL